jgi:hypothetical protein
VRLAFTALLFLAACGDPLAPRLTKLRCREEGCQSVENPFRVQLAVDFADDDADAAAGTATVTVDGVDQEPAPMAEVMARSGLDGSAKQGTLVFDVELLPVRLEDGMVFEIGLRVEDGRGRVSNEPRMKLQVNM